VKDITLRIGGNAPSFSRRGDGGLVEALAKQWQDVVGVGVAPEHRLREDEVLVEMHVEDPVGARNHFDCRDLALPLLQDPRGQTGRVRERPSGDAVFDPDPVVGHRLEFKQSSTRLREESERAEV
jgi:hypothetical protein